MGTTHFNSWMHEALHVAERSLPVDIPVGCIILNSSGQRIGEGWNTREKTSSPSGHAEIMALEMAANTVGDWRLNGCTAVVTLEPCAMCAAALLQARIFTIVFGAYSPQDGALGSVLNLPTVYDTTINSMGGILECECTALLQTFFASKRAVNPS